MYDIYLPLPYTPIIPNLEPRVLFKLGRFYHGVELGKEYTLTSAEGIFASTFFTVMVTGFYREFILVQSPISTVISKATESFFSLNNPQNYRRLSQEEYDRLYPEECKLLPGRII